MTSKRQPYTIAFEMLHTALSGAHKTRLLYSCKISGETSKKYISTLLRKGLLEKKENAFYTTKKGIQFIETYQELERLWQNNIIAKTVQRSQIRKKKLLGFVFSFA